MPSVDHAPWRPSGIVTFLTDFGLHDTYVGVMKGVLASLEPTARAIDLTHAVPPQDLRSAAFHLRHAWSWFPAGTVHVAVVDPGVGTARDILVASSGGHLFLAPDNGLLGPVLAADAVVRRLEVERHGLAERSATFHGRDVFTPAAARFAGGLDPAEAGPEVSDWERLAFPTPGSGDLAAGDELSAEVLVVDRFGNLITNLPGERVRGCAFEAAAGGRIAPGITTYGEVQPGDLCSLVDSYGLVEVAVREGDAARELGLAAGAPVTIRRRER